MKKIKDKETGERMEKEYESMIRWIWYAEYLIRVKIRLKNICSV